MFDNMYSLIHVIYFNKTDISHKFKYLVFQSKGMSSNKYHLSLFFKGNIVSKFLQGTGICGFDKQIQRISGFTCTPPTAGCNVC